MTSLEKLQSVLCLLGHYMCSGMCWLVLIEHDVHRA